MTLTSGQTLSSYEILGLLGAGGMGEVYRARDTRLEREVAIKVLPEELAGDEERLRRFEREAKTLAGSYNQPNDRAARQVRPGARPAELAYRGSGYWSLRSLSADSRPCTQT